MPRSALRIAWATDLHLNFVEVATAERFLERVRNAGCGALLVGGDIAMAPDLATWLGFLDERIDEPIYFVLGNHDYYGGDVAGVRRQVRALQGRHLVWLPDAGVVTLTPRVALVGHGGWADARLGDFSSTTVILDDYVAIHDLRTAGPVRADAPFDPLYGWEHRDALAARLRSLGDDAAATLRPALLDALAAFPEVWVLTHVPPFREACWHGGRPSDDAWLPGFTCGALGDLLREAAGRFPQRSIRVLCGHTHADAEAWPLPNLHVETQGARYGAPTFRVLHAAT